MNTHLLLLHSSSLCLTNEHKGKKMKNKQTNTFNANANEVHTLIHVNLYGALTAQILKWPTSLDHMHCDSCRSGGGLLSPPLSECPRTLSKQCVKWFWSPVTIKEHRGGGRAISNGERQLSTNRSHGDEARPIRGELRAAADQSQAPLLSHMIATSSRMWRDI